MRFDDFDMEMRQYEESLDQYVPEEDYIVVRLDGRSFTRLTKRVCKFKAPFDERFRDLMTGTVKSLMESGFKIVYGYTESDEISLLFHPGENTFSRKVRKINSTLSGEASAAFSLKIGQIATFDSRVVPLPNKKRVGDYFRWRQEDSQRNALNGYCYWTLRDEGKTASQASKVLNGKGPKFKKELLAERGIDFDAVANWQKYGCGIYYKDVEREGFNPVKNEKVIVKRRELFVDMEIPYGVEYRDYVLKFLDER
ncbi:tRNA(His) guanylyltransferase Thg1 family protein [Methanobrevibacter sp.]|uniref:tRNA(His) guanylyltransferase Thg1 family protein n=1 Tax=Methanobrevibacter sp. TaxID=66852 RepID=UPI003864C55E